MPRVDPEQFIVPYDTGYYRLSQSVALIATQAAAPASIFSCRWTDATRLMMVERLRMKWLQTAAWTATQVESVGVSIARSYTVTDTGGTSVLANVIKRRTTMAGTLLGDARVATSAAGIVAGTRALDSGDLDAMLTVNTITNINTIVYDVTLDWDIAKHPIILAQNEGIVARLGSALPAAGTATFYIELDWGEIDSF